jgi:hypothetical protein
MTSRKCVANVSREGKARTGGVWEQGAGKNFGPHSKKLTELTQNVIVRSSKIWILRLILLDWLNTRVDMKY